MTSKSPNLILITGNDEVGIKKKAYEVSKKFGLNDETEFNFEITHGDNENKTPLEIFKDFLTSVNTPPFLVPSKVVWLKHFQYFNLAIGKEKKNKTFQELLKQFIENLESGILQNYDIKIIIDGPELDKRSAFYKFFNKNGKTYEINKLEFSDKKYTENLHAKIRDLCNKENLSVSNEVIEFLAASIGSDSGLIENEIKKLVTYTIDKDNVTLEDCKEICSRSNEMANWAFSEALAEKNIKESFKALNILIHNLISEKKSASNPELTMFYSALRKFQNLLKIKVACNKLNPPDNLNYYKFKPLIESHKDKGNEDILSGMHPYRAYKLFLQSKNFEDNEFTQIFREFLKANSELVSGTISPRVILENLIMKICDK